MRVSPFISLLFGFAFPRVAFALTGVDFEPITTCQVSAAGDPTIDDGPAILAAFQECSSNARVVFGNNTYHVNSVLNISNLQNVKIDIYGTLLVSFQTRLILAPLYSKPLILTIFTVVD